MSVDSGQRVPLVVAPMRCPSQKGFQTLLKLTITLNLVIIWYQTSGWRFVLFSSWWFMTRWQSREISGLSRKICLPGSSHSLLQIYSILAVVSAVDSFAQFLGTLLEPNTKIVYLFCWFVCSLYMPLFLEVIHSSQCKKADFSVSKTLNKKINETQLPSSLTWAAFTGNVVIFWKHVQFFFVV